MRQHRLFPQAHEYSFTVQAPFTVVAAAIDTLGTLTVRESDELHVLATPLHGGALCARPTYPDHVQVIVAEDRDGLVAQEFADVLSALLGCRTEGPLLHSEPVSHLARP